MDKYSGWRIFLIFLAIVALVIISVTSVNAATPKPYVPPTPSQPSGFGALIAGFFNKVLENKGGGGSWWDNLFGNKPSIYSQTMCDPTRPGYNKNGVLDVSCGGTGAGVCNPFACDPNKPEYNMCGDKGFPCRCGDPDAVC